MDHLDQDHPGLLRHEKPLFHFQSAARPHQVLRSDVQASGGLRVGGSEPDSLIRSDCFSTNLSAKQIAARLHHSHL
jgi:hypothetical protein